MPTVLITGFEPFDGASTNASWEAVRLLTGRPGIVTAELPVEFGRASEVLEALIREHEPDIVIAVGLAGDRSSITPERVAINLEDARIPDNAGAKPSERPIVSNGPAAIWSGLPVTAIVARLREHAIPADVSLSAGAFVCNSVMYRLLRGTEGRATVAGFIHVPSENVIDSATTARALELAVNECLAVVARG